MAYDTTQMKNLLSELKTRQKNSSIELSSCPEGSLIHTKRGDYINYYQVIGAKDQRKRYGITKNPELIRNLARKKYLETELKILDKDIASLSRLLQSYTDPTAEYVLSRLPKRYKALHENLFFPKSETSDGWAAEPYEQNTRNLHEKIHITSKGLRVRSKSELIIADKLDQYNIAYRYDSLIYFENLTFSPDFVFKTRNGMMYWEHCGMMSNHNYRSSNEWRLSNYKRMGIVPWKNLIITYDMDDGGLNLGSIEAEIKYKLLPAGVLRISA